MNGLQIVEQEQPLQWARQQGLELEATRVGRHEVMSDSARAWRAALLGLNPMASSHPREQTSPAPEGMFARQPAAQDVPPAPAPPLSARAVRLGPRTVDVLGERRSRRAAGPPPVRRVPYIDRTREMKWIREHQAEYAGMYVALEGDQVIAADLDAKTVFAAVRAAGIARPLVVHMEPADALPFAGW